MDRTCEAVCAARAENCADDACYCGDVTAGLYCGGKAVEGEDGRSEWIGLDLNAMNLFHGIQMREIISSSCSRLP